MTKKKSNKFYSEKLKKILKCRQLKMIWRQRLLASKKKVVARKMRRQRNISESQYNQKSNGFFGNQALKNRAAQYLLRGLCGMQKAQYQLLKYQGTAKNWQWSGDTKKQLYRAAMTAGLATGLMLGYGAMGGSNAFAMPQDGQIVAGQGTVTIDGKTMDIKQVTDKMIIDWQKFGIDPNEAVKFVQPGANSVALSGTLGVGSNKPRCDSCQYGYGSNGER